MSTESSLPEAHTDWQLADWLEYLQQQHHKEIDLGLERIGQVANALSAAKPAPFVVTVAGTNGKGSTVRYLEQMLLAAGQRTATYTSPHFLRYNERVRINGRELEDAAHCRAFAAVEAARGTTSLTYFEFATLAALWLIEQHEVDIAILEIGLGGRLDAVNLVEPDVAVVTTVGIDHVEFLGNDREQIGFEKAGVYRPGKPAICADPNPPQRLLDHAETIGADLVCVTTDFTFERTSETDWCYVNPAHQVVMDKLPLPQLPLVNAATALTVLQHLPVIPDRAAIEKGLSKARLPGRLEIFSQSPLVILDVAHNPHAAAYLASQLSERWPGRRVLAVCAMLKDKDIEGTLACLTDKVSTWYLAATPGPRGAPAERLALALADSQTKTFATVASAYQSALTDAEEGDIVLCFGSFLTIQAIYELEG